jgi:DNA-binding NarL/FixJ family response regulator
MRVTEPTSLRRISVLIVDDHPVVRKALSLRLAQNSNLMVCAAVGTVAHALQAAELHRPDLAILDLQLPDGSGFDVIKALREGHPGTLILVFSMQPADVFLPLAKEAGAHAFVTKSDAPGKVLTAIDHILGSNRSAGAGRLRRIPAKKKRRTSQA